MKDKSAVIIIDTGFSLESLHPARKIVATINVATGRVDTGSPFINWSEHSDVLSAFAHDPLNHGSLVLKSLTALAPDLPVVLVRGYDEQQKLARTVFKHGKQVRSGWTEAYLKAVQICRERRLASVANLSFGGYHHALDGTGWESHCLAQVTGAGKPGHIVVAGAGAGNGSAVHASWLVLTGNNEEVVATQSSATTYNLWCAADADALASNDWLLEVFLNGSRVVQELSGHVRANLWNHRKQICFRVPGAGQVRIRISRFWIGDTENGGSLLAGGGSRRRGFLRRASDQGETDDRHGEPLGIVAKRGTSTRTEVSQVRSKLDPLGFDCWISQGESDAVFLNHEDAMSIAEPAIFPHVIAVGLASGDYAADQNQPGRKPELLLAGNGPISFRLPEVAAQVARLLAADPSLDVVAVRERLKSGKSV